MRHHNPVHTRGNTDASADRTLESPGRSSTPLGCASATANRMLLDDEYHQEKPSSAETAWDTATLVGLCRSLQELFRMVQKTPRITLEKQLI